MRCRLASQASSMLKISCSNFPFLFYLLTISLSLSLSFFSSDISSRRYFTSITLLKLSPSKKLWIPLRRRNIFKVSSWYEASSAKWGICAAGILTFAATPWAQWGGFFYSSILEIGDKRAPQYEIRLRVSQYQKRALGKLYSSIFTITTIRVHSIRKFQLWWHEVDDDDYSGDNNQKLCENNESTHPTTKSNRITQPIQFPFYKWFNHFTWNCQMHTFASHFKNFDFLQCKMCGYTMYRWSKRNEGEIWCA